MRRDVLVKIVRLHIVRIDIVVRRSIDTGVEVIVEVLTDASVC